MKNKQITEKLTGWQKKLLADQQKNQLEQERYLINKFGHNAKLPTIIKK